MKGDNPLSILTLNNKIITLGGSVLNYTPPPASMINKYTIQVKADSDSSVTGVCDGTTVTFQEVSTGVYNATVTKTGTWIITATKGQMSATAYIEIKSNYYEEMVYKAVALTSPQSGLNYVNGVPNDWDIMKEIGKAISDASSSITANTTEPIYVNKGSSWAYKITPGDTIAVNGNLYAVMGFNNQKLTNTSSYGGNNTYAGLTFGMVDCCGKYPMNSSHTNEGCWGASLMRTSTMESLKTGMPSTMAKVRIPYYERNGLLPLNNDDYMFLPAEKEVYGARSYSPIVEANALTQFAYYKNGGSMIKNYDGSAAWWWLRSVYSSDNAQFCCMAVEGSAAVNEAGFLGGAAPCFCV